MQSVEVDENNPEYIAAKAKANAKLKNKFESIFAKYQGMPEAMTDEINIRTGEIVVDRGHLRKLDREYRRRRKPGQGLLDDLIADQLADELEEEGEDEEEKEGDMRDELAPSLSPEPCIQKQKQANATDTAVPPPPNLSTPSQQAHHIDIPPGLDVPSHQENPLSSFTNPTTDWSQFIQFPQTPAGQVAQNSFMTQITQAVQQAVAPIISNLLSNTPSALPLATPIDQPSVRSAPNHQDTTPATHPTPQIPISADRPDLPVHALSSPAPSRPRSHRRVALAVHIRNTRRKPAKIPTKVVEGTSTGPPTAMTNSARVEESPLKSSNDKDHRTKSPEEIHHLPTPSSIEQNQHADGDAEDGDGDVMQGLEDMIASGRHFDEDDRDLLSITDGEHVVADMEQQTTTGSMPLDFEPTTEATPELDDIIPSIELEAHEPCPSPQAAKKRRLSSIEPSMPEPTSALSSTETSSSSSSLSNKKQKVDHNPTTFQLDSDPEDADPNPIDAPLPSPKRKRASISPHTHPHRPRGRPRSNKDAEQASTTIPAIPLNDKSNDGIDEDDDEDELLTPIQIKCEPVSPSLQSLPLPTTLSTSTSNQPRTAASSTTKRNRAPPNPAFQTPRSAPQPFPQSNRLPSTPSSSSAANSREKAQKLGRSAFLRKVKQAWAEDGRRSAKKATPMRIRAQVKVKQEVLDEDSEDELAR